MRQLSERTTDVRRPAARRWVAASIALALLGPGAAAVTIVGGAGAAGAGAAAAPKPWGSGGQATRQVGSAPFKRLPGGVRAAQAGGPQLSTNWSGYVVTGAQFTAVAADWTVASVVPSQSFEDAATWVGIDGLDTSTLIQTGTDQETQGGQTLYFAWVELLPKPADEIGPVTPGDHMHASITKGASAWTVTIADITSKQQFSEDVPFTTFSTPGDSAEWIVEAPTVNNQQVAMANYGSIPISNATFGTAGSSASTSMQPFEMVDNVGQIVSYPSTFSSNQFTMNFGSPPAGTPPPTSTTTPPSQAPSQLPTGTPTSSTTTGAPAPVAPSVNRLAGASRITTAIAVSAQTFPGADSAQTAILASGSSFADALAGTPLATAKHGPLLLTDGSALDPNTASELQRVLAPGGTVYLLGGTLALSDAVAAQVRQLGFTVVRYAGPDRFATAAVIAAQGLGSPGIVLEANGNDFPDALAAGAAAAHAGGAVLLTAGSTQSPETASYLAAHPGTDYAIGGSAASADPGAIAVVGADRYETATLVAQHFFPTPTAVGIASGATFPDALAGGAHIAHLGGPMILVPPSGSIPSSVVTYLQSLGSTVSSAFAYGGSLALPDAVLSQVSQAIG